MSLGPNASLAEPPKCATCDGDKKDQQMAAASSNKTYVNGAGDRSIEVFTNNKGNMMVTTFDGGGNEIGTWHLGADGNLQ